MNIVLWVLQILLGLLFMLSGSMKFVMSAEQMNASSAVAFPGWFFHFIGICEILGGIGLIVPWLTGIKKGLTPLAASLLIVIMVGATIVNAMGSSPATIITLVVGLLLVVIARGRSRAT